ncbi:hypothetical protein [Streptomyces kasugaensis]|uniref:hypothetical protein n=1 Tax=Streptomyces kasugaensis TaxID=1946 RepID=UPI001A953879|nr:hypothetical protein [Streptomyces kasugaensis]
MAAAIGAGQPHGPVELAGFPRSARGSTLTLFRFTLSITTPPGRRTVAAALGSPVTDDAEAGPRGPAGT